MSTVQKLLIAVSLLIVNIPSVLADGTNVPTIDKPQLTEAQATQIAVDFCQRIGQPKPHAGKADFSPVSKRGTGQAHHWQPCWQVTFPDSTNEIEVEIVDTTGVISHYLKHDDMPTYDLRTGKRLRSVSSGPSLPQTQAVKQATTALENAGAFKTNELLFKGASLSHISVDDSGEWFVSWERMFHGVPYRDQGVNAGIDAVTGELTGFSVNFHTPAPESVVLNVSQAQAQTIAAKQMADTGLQADAPLNVHAEVIQPNTYWQAGGSEDPLPYARVAWVYQYEIDSQVYGPRIYEVWIDQETGGVIGGQVSGTRDQRRHSRIKGKKTSPAKSTSVPTKSAAPKH